MLINTADGVKPLSIPPHAMAYGPHNGKLRFVRRDGTPIYVYGDENEIRVKNHNLSGIDFALSKGNIGSSVVELTILPHTFAINTFNFEYQNFGPFNDSPETALGLSALPAMFIKALGKEKIVIKGPGSIGL